MQNTVFILPQQVTRRPFRIPLFARKNLLPKLAKKNENRRIYIFFLTFARTIIKTKELCLHHTMLLRKEK